MDEIIGLQGEKTLHSILKNRYDPDPQHQEVRVCGFVADIYRDGEIIEIQTAGFGRMKRKLSALLPNCRVNIVYPIERVKMISWIDPESGETTKPRRSPKIGNLYDSFYELMSLGDMLLHPNLTVTLLPFDLEEHRLRDGWGSGGKRGCHRFDRFPTAFGEETVLREAEDYLRFIPDGLSEPFYSSDFAKAAGIKAHPARNALLCLTRIGIVCRGEYSRRGYSYTIPKA